MSQARHQKTLECAPLHLLPFERHQFIYRLNTHLSFALAFVLGFLLFKPQKMIGWIFHPRFYSSIRYLKLLFGSSLMLLYDCLDYMGFKNPQEEAFIRQSEYLLLSHADLVTANSASLSKKHTAFQDKIKVVPSGFRAQDFSAYTSFSASKVRGKVSILYVGSLNYRVNFKLLQRLVSRHPEWHFTIIGSFYPNEQGKIPETKLLNKLLKLPNVTHIGYTSPSELPPFYLQSHIGIIPYNMDVPLNVYCNPLKLLEYFYFGLPVVSSPIPALKSIESAFLSTATSLSDWETAVTRYISTRPSRSQQHQLRKLALANSWEKKIETIFNYLKL